MAIERDDTDERQARIDLMIVEFRTAQHRRLLKREMGLWKRAEAAELAKTFGPRPVPEKIH